jgi:outer membrane receptor protein involved in Fe transport
MRSVVVRLFATALLAGVASAQVTTASLHGVVTDPTGGVVAGAKILLESVNRGAARTTVSDNEGRYSFGFVTVGSYRLTVSQSGFRDVVHADLVLTAGDNVSLPVRMEVQGVSENVTVAAQAGALESATQEQRSTVGSGQLNELPVQHQDWTTLLPMSAGATRPASASTVTSNSPAGSGLNINGLPSAGYNLTVDGTNATSNPEFTSFNFYQGPNVINTLNNDAIEEVDLVRGVPPATVGNAMSGAINLVTKSGSNQFHGGAHVLNEASLYDARNQFLTTKPRTTFNEYGGSLGGPILRDKLFFFGSYAGARLSQSRAITGLVPSPYLISISPSVYAPLFALFPTAPQPGNNPTATTAQFFGVGRAVQKDGNGAGRIDYYINAKNILAVRYIRARPDLVAPNLLPANSRTTLGHTDALNANYTHASGHWTENTRIGFNRLKYTRIDNGYGIQIPQLTFGFSSQGSNQFLQHGSYTTVEEGVAAAIGKHNLQFGGIYQRLDSSRVKLGNAILGYSTLAQFLANTPTSVSDGYRNMPPGTPAFGYITRQYGLYMQDDIRLAANLRLNLGMRYDIFTVPREYLDRVYNRDYDPAAPQLGPGFGPYRPVDSIYRGDHNNFQPRAGLVYSPGARTVVRASFGILTEGHNMFTGPTGIGAISPTLPGGVNLNQAQTQAAGLKYPINADDYPQLVTSLLTQGILTPTFATGISINSNNPDPYSIQWMFGVERTLPSGLKLEVDYTGNRGLRETMYENINMPDRLTGVPARPGFGSFNLFTPEDRSKYNALQVTLTRTLKQGVFVSAGYTYSKVMSFGDADVLQQLQPQDNNNIRADYGPAPFDTRSRFVANGTWEPMLPRWLGVQSKLATGLFGGWRVSGVLSAQTGLPVNVTNTSSTYPADRPDAGGNSPYLSGYESGLHQYLNAAAFVLVPMSTASNAQIRGGNLGRYALRAPGLVNLDASLAKTVTFSERLRLQVRADTFNTTNHTNLAGLVTAINTSSFGRLTTATARTMQLGARLIF